MQDPPLRATLPGGPAQDRPSPWSEAPAQPHQLAQPPEPPTRLPSAAAVEESGTPAQAPHAGGGGRTRGRPRTNPSPLDAIEEAIAQIEQRQQQAQTRLQQIEEQRRSVRAGLKDLDRQLSEVHSRRRSARATAIGEAVLARLGGGALPDELAALLREAGIDPGNLSDRA